MSKEEKQSKLSLLVFSYILADTKITTGNTLQLVPFGGGGFLYISYIVIKLKEKELISPDFFLSKFKLLKFLVPITALLKYGTISVGLV